MNVSDFEAVIGLEVHLELHLHEKMFCSTRASFGADPNTQVCPETLGLPGSLPVVNEQAVFATIRAGLALGCEISTFTKFDRKHYYYPDLPKGYQISQYDLPLCQRGSLTFPVGAEEKTVRITRVHLEEDTGKLIHQPGSTNSQADLNRAGIALVEIVSEPDVRSAEEAVGYLKELKAVLSYLDISDCNMEEGSLRCEPNISIRPVGSDRFGTKTEIKNLNSFKVVQSSIEHELVRQAELLRAGKPVVQETRLWDETTQSTRAMRSKEEAHDYRYFPDPDIPPLEISEPVIERARASLPTSPRERRRHLVELGVPDYNAEIIVRDRAYADFFERSLEVYSQPQKISNLLIGGFLEEVNDRGLSSTELPVSPVDLAHYARLIDEGKIGAARKQILNAMFETGKSPEVLIDELGVAPISDRDELTALVGKIIGDNPKIVDQIRGGKTSAVMALVGQTMKATRGRANPQLVQELFREQLEIQ